MHRQDRDEPRWVKSMLREAIWLTSTFNQCLLSTPLPLSIGSRDCYGIELQESDRALCSRAKAACFQVSLAAVVIRGSMPWRHCPSRLAPLPRLVSATTPAG